VRAGLSAQTQETKTTTTKKIEMKGGENVTAIRHAVPRCEVDEDRLVFLLLAARD
jgi:hypothetical protein